MTPGMFADLSWQFSSDGKRAIALQGNRRDGKGVWLCCSVSSENPNLNTVILTLRGIGTTRIMENANRFIAGDEVELMT